MIVAAAVPNEIGIETVNYCNARCPFCPLFQGDDQLDRNIRPATTMTTELFAKIVSEIQGWETKPGCIYLNMDGEPLMDPLFLERLDVLKRSGLAPLVFLQTNGQFMDNSKARAIIDAGIGTIFYALDGATKETYEASRVRCDFETVLRNLKDLARMRDLLKGKTRINLKYVRTTRNADEVRECHRMVSGFLSPELDSFHDTISVDWASDDMAASGLVFQDMGDAKKRGFRDGGCPSVRSLMVVHADGRVPACCWDYNFFVRKGEFGSAAETSLLDAWHGAPFTELRRTLGSPVAGQMPERCESCMMMYEPPQAMPASAIDDAALVTVSPGYGYIYRFAAAA